MSEQDILNLLVLYLQQKDKMSNEEKEIILNALKISTIEHNNLKELL
jgi:hypothetical protein